jgi:beta-aspartyl-peptidase (threonine type)
LKLHRLLPALAALLAACTTTARSDEVLAVLHAQQEAWNRGDLVSFVELGYWRSPELCFFSGGDVTRGYDGLIERYQARYASDGAEMGALTFSELEVFELEPELAVARGRWQLERQRLGDVGGLFTLVLRKTSDGWRIVHDHTSAAEPGS